VCTPIYSKWIKPDAEVERCGSEPMFDPGEVDAEPRASSSYREADAERSYARPNPRENEPDKDRPKAWRYKL